jgi:sugar phosphate permease
MPTLGFAIALLLVRSSISQVDVPARKSYVMAIVAPEERSAASGVTNVARTIGASLSPVLAGALMAQAATLSLPLMIAGGLKIVYDLALYFRFREVRPAEERGPLSGQAD